MAKETLAGWNGGVIIREGAEGLGAINLSEFIDTLNSLLRLGGSESNTRITIPSMPGGL